MKHVSRCFAFFLCLSFANPQSPDSHDPPSYQLIRALLEMPSPPPSAGLSEAKPEQTVSSGFAEFSAPPDDAPLGTLGLYWIRMDRHSGSKPTPAVRLRLLEYAEANP